MYKRIAFILLSLLVVVSGASPVYAVALPYTSCSYADVQSWYTIIMSQQSTNNFSSSKNWVLYRNGDEVLFRQADTVTITGDTYDFSGTGKYVSGLWIPDSTTWGYSPSTAGFYFQNYGCYAVSNNVTYASWAYDTKFVTYPEIVVEPEPSDTGLTVDDVETVMDNTLVKYFVISFSASFVIYLIRRISYAPDK